MERYVCILFAKFYSSRLYIVNEHLKYFSLQLYFPSYCNRSFKNDSNYKKLDALHIVTFLVYLNKYYLIQLLLL
jgi:hypothetical protein